MLTFMIESDQKLLGMIILCLIVTYFHHRWVENNRPQQREGGNCGEYGYKKLFWNSH